MKTNFITLLIILIIVSACQNSTESNPDPLTLSHFATDVTIYGGSDGSINLIVNGGTSPYSYAWSNGAATQDISNLTAGEYVVIVTDAANEVITYTITLNQPRQLIRLTSNQTDSYPRWSPDGETIAFTSQGGIWTLPSAGGTAQQLISNNGRSLAWSPDGLQIAFVKEVGNREDIWILSLSDNTETQITSGDVGGSRPSWSPDGTRLAVEYGFDIWIIYLDGTAPTRLIEHSANDHSPGWSPDGTTISFTSDRTGYSELWTVPSTGGEAVQMTDYQALVLYPTWSPDGLYIVFSNLADPANDIYNIFIIPSAGGEATMLINNSGYDSYPCFSPDGSKVVFASLGEAGNSGLWVVSVE